MTIKPSLSFVILGLASFIVVSSRLVSCTASDNTPPALLATDGKLSEAEKVARGQYLVDLGGCNDCHTPKLSTPTGTKLDSSRLLSGHPSQTVLPAMDQRAFRGDYWMFFSPGLTAYVGIWGVTFSANLTPDSATGIGAWSENDFIATLRTGRHLGQDSGRRILPPMPWSKFGKMTDEDIKSVYAFLRLLPPVRNRVPVPIPPYGIK